MGAAEPGGEPPLSEAFPHPLSKVDTPADAPAGMRGWPCRYYGRTEVGRVALRLEAARLRDALDLARRRDLLPEGQG